MMTVSVLHNSQAMDHPHTNRGVGVGRGRGHKSQSAYDDDNDDNDVVEGFNGNDPATATAAATSTTDGYIGLGTGTSGRQGGGSRGSGGRGNSTANADANARSSIEPPGYIAPNAVISSDNTINGNCARGGGVGTEVLRPGEHDVLLGRGGGTNNHEGNINFRNLVNQHKMRYLAASKIDKPKVAKEVVEIWKTLTPPGRFLQKKESSSSNSPASPSSSNDGSKGSDRSDDSVWVQVSDKKAREKASQCLRERTADVMPYLSQLQQQREVMREQGVSMISHHLAVAQKNGEELPAGRPQGRYGSLSLTNMMMGNDGGMNQQLLTHNRRVSMPAANHVTSMNSQGTPDRRMSMPVGGASSSSKGVSATPGSLGGGRMGMNSPAFGEHLGSVEQRVLQDAYSAIERAGGPDPANVMFMEQLLQEERMRERQVMMAEREALMQERMIMQQERMMMQQQMPGQVPGLMSPFSGDQGGMMIGSQAGWSPMMGGGCGNGMGMASNYTEMMFQQQQMMVAAQQGHQLTAHAMMMEQQMAMNGNATPHSTTTGNTVVGAEARPDNVDGKPGVVSVVDMEPIPFLEDGSTDGIPLSIIPDVTKSLAAVITTPDEKYGSQPDQKSNKNRSDDRDDCKQAARHVSNTPNDNKDNDQVETVVPLKEAPTSASRKLKSAFRRSSGTERRPATTAGAPAVAPGQQPTDEANLVEYRKTLENYMSSHKINAPTAVDALIDDDFSDDEEDIGVDASAWVAQTLNDSGSISMNNTKKKKRTKKDHSGHHNKSSSCNRDPERGVGRTKSNESFMSTDKSFDGKSMDGMSLMSLAISEVEETLKQHPGGGHDSMESLEEGSVDFAGRDGSKHNPRRSSFMSSNQSIMSELTDFSDREEEDIGSDDEEDL